MTYPLRLFRAIARTHQSPAPLSARAAEQEALIRAFAADMLIQAGRPAVTFTLLAGSLGITTGAIKRLFACMDDLLHSILIAHLDRLSTAMAAVSEDIPDHLAALRRAYRGALQDEAGAMLPAHHLLLTQAATLPQDLRDDIAGLREAFGDMLAPGLGKFALMLLDDPDLPLEEAEEYIALKTARLSAPSQAAPCESANQADPEPEPAAAVPGSLGVRFARPPKDPDESDLWSARTFRHQGLARAGP